MPSRAEPKQQADTRGGCALLGGPERVADCERSGCEDGHVACVRASRSVRRVPRPASRVRSCVNGDVARIGSAISTPLSTDVWLRRQSAGASLCHVVSRAVLFMCMMYLYCVLARFIHSLRALSVCRRHPRMARDDGLVKRQRRLGPLAPPRLPTHQPAPMPRARCRRWVRSSGDGRRRPM